MREFMVSVITPLLLHMLISELTPAALAALGGGRVDSAVSTTVTAILVLPAAFWMYAGDRRREKKLQSRDEVGAQRPVRWKRLSVLLLCFVAGGVLNLVWSRVLLLLSLQEHFSNITQERLLAGELAVQVIGLGILVPLSEELVFRGLIFRRMLRGLGRTQAVFFSALLFAVYHGNVIQMVFAFPLALLLAVLCDRSKGLGLPVAFHMGVNLTAVLAAQLG